MPAPLQTPAAPLLGGRPAPWWTSVLVHQVHPPRLGDHGGDTAPSEARVFLLAAPTG